MSLGVRGAFVTAPQDGGPHSSHPRAGLHGGSVGLTPSLSLPGSCRGSSHWGPAATGRGGSAGEAGAPSPPDRPPAQHLPLSAQPWPPSCGLRPRQAPLVSSPSAKGGRGEHGSGGSDTSPPTPGVTGRGQQDHAACPRGSQGWWVMAGVVGYPRSRPAAKGSEKGWALPTVVFPPPAAPRAEELGCRASR